jgi:hypothetical protein
LIEEIAGLQTALAAAHQDGCCGETKCYSSPMKEQHIGSNLDDILKQDGSLAECEAGALKRVAD